MFRLFLNYESILDQKINIMGNRGFYARRSVAFHAVHVELVGRLSQERCGGMNIRTAYRILLLTAFVKRATYGKGEQHD